MSKTELDYFKENYLANYNDFMNEWAKEIRAWTNCEDAVFYKDGIFDADKWFGNENFRPLFILKEVHEPNKEAAEKEAKNHAENEKEKYGEDKSIQNCIDFVGVNNYGSDPWEGKRMWNRIGTLASALYKLHKNKKDINYENVNITMDKIDGTEETLRQKALKNVAIINLKKIGGGSNVGSDKSKETLCFECHAKRFYNKLIEQICFIQPTFVICCGKDVVANSLGLIDNDRIIKDELEIDSLNGEKQKVPVINGYHPSNQNGIEKFYYKTLEEVINRDLINKKGICKE